MQKIPPYLTALLEKTPTLLKTRTMPREAAAVALGQAIVSAPEWAEMMAWLTPEQGEQVKMEQGRMAHDLMTGVHLAMAQHAPELPMLEHLSAERVQVLSAIPNLKTISPALAQAVADYLGTASD